MFRDCVARRLRWLIGFSLLLSPVAYGQAEPPALAVLRQRLVGQTLTVRIAGLHAATRVLLRPIDNRIVNGNAQPRRLDMLRGEGDFLLNPGSAVQVSRVEGASDAHGDLLRVGVSAAGGAYVSLAFALSRGALAASSVQQLAEIVAPVLQGPALAWLLGAPVAQRASTSPAAVATNSAATPVPAPGPRPRPHPANTVVDLPPAAPGYPPLHASKPAEEGCWWEPVLVAKYRLEMLTQRCNPDHKQFGDDFVYGTDATGIAMGEPGHVDSHVFDVLTKPAEQPFTTTLRVKYIVKLKSAPARASCAPHRMNAPTSPVQTYDVQPTGAYARQARFHQDDDSSDDPCPGLASNDAVALYFQYTPDNSKTQYLFFDYQDLIPFDESSIRFSSSAAPDTGTVP